ncbi:FAST kinase domain-containing protein 4-like [Amphiura filiformis]|uniref:FAST kinase domain-containing protein 4-like n=1 Tax=Amphiura filiformis TaxID=82378 RepID=UPI003B22752A
MIRSLLNTYTLKLNNKNRAVVETLVEGIRSGLRSMDVSVVSNLVCGAGLLKSAKGSKGNNLASGLVDEAAHILQLRQREIDRLRPHALIGLLQVSNHFPQSFQTVVADALLGSLHKFSFVDLKNLTTVMSNVPFRSPAILRAIMYQAMQLSDQWQLPSVAKFMRALGELSFHNQDLAKQVAEFVVTKQSEWTPSLISQIAKAYSLLRIHVPEWGLFDQICEYTANHLDDFSSLELYLVLYAFGELGYKPKNETEFYQSVTAYLESRFDDYPAETKIKLASALMLSEQVPEFMLKDVLQHKRPAGAVFQDVLVMRLNAHAHLACPNYSGPYVDSTLIPAVSHQSSALGRSVVQALKEAVGGNNKCVKTSVGTTLGYKIDALVLLDENSKPVAVDQYQLSGVQSNESGQKLQEVFEILDIHQKPLPAEYQRIAVLTWSPKERIFDKDELTGRYNLQKKHLQLAGYKLMEVDYQEWNRAKTKFQQLSLIKFKLVEATRSKVENIQE